MFDYLMVLADDSLMVISLIFERFFSAAIHATHSWSMTTTDDYPSGNQHIHIRPIYQMPYHQGSQRSLKHT